VKGVLASGKILLHSVSGENGEKEVGEFLRNKGKKRSSKKSKPGGHAYTKKAECRIRGGEKNKGGR